MQENGSLWPNRHAVSQQNLPRNNKQVQGVILTFIMKPIFVSYCSSQVRKLSEARRELIAIAHGCVMSLCFTHFGFVLRSCSFCFEACIFAAQQDNLHVVFCGYMFLPNKINTLSVGYPCSIRLL
jgi:hypothetical protein